MKKDVDLEEKDHRFKSDGGMPFPYASPTPQQIEEQAFYENFSGTGCCSVFSVVKTLFACTKKMIKTRLNRR